MVWCVEIQMLLCFFQVFGNGVTDVLLSQGVIVVSYSNKSVKLYSFEHIVPKVCMRVHCTPLSKLSISFDLNVKLCTMNTNKISEYLNIQCLINRVAHLAVYISLYLINSSFFSI